MSRTFQKSGAPSYASTLQGEPPTYKPSMVGGSRGNSPQMLPGASQNQKYSRVSVASNVRNHLPSTSSNLNPYPQPHARTPKPMVAGSIVPGTSLFDKNSATTSPSTRQGKQAVTKGATTNSKLISLDQKSIVESMKNVSVASSQKPESVLIGRCLNWERPTPSSSSKKNKCLPKVNGTYSKPATSEYSVSYKRKPNQTPMDQAGFREYAPFLRSEFEVSAIIRRNVHEPDYMGPAVPAFAPGSQMSQTSTLVSKGGKGFKEHRSTGDFGPIYSEDRYFIVVSLCKITYYALPCYTHEKRGLANIAEKEDWISIKDHRSPESCQQQSEHVPLCTATMAADAHILNAKTTAWLPYAIPIRYSVPVAYQGKLDQASAERVRRLFLEHLGDES